MNKLEEEEPPVVVLVLQLCHAESTSSCKSRQAPPCCSVT